MPLTPDKESFFASIIDAIDAGTFVSLSLGKPRRKASDIEVPQKLRASFVLIKNERRMRLLYRYPRRDVTEIHGVEPAIAKMRELLGDIFLSGTLFTTQADWSLVFNKRGEAKLHRAAASKATLPTLDHNRKKHRVVDPQSSYLVPLGIATKDGSIKPTMASKFKQINRFVEIVGELINATSLAKAPKISVVDIGSGKGYLTFALYDWLHDQLGKDTSITGIEARKELASFCDQVARQLEYDQLRFVTGEAGRVPIEQVDMVLALHACDTATDDAIYRGIVSQAVVIVCAPCCQHQLAPQLHPSHPALKSIYRFGLLKQRQADLVTDAGRALLLESMGYRVKMIEFVSTEHSNKNLMIAATQDPNVDRAAAQREFESLKELFGFEHHALESLLQSRRDIPSPIAKVAGTLRVP